MCFTMTRESACSECASSRAGVVQCAEKGLIRLSHRGRVEIVEMHCRELRRIMTFSTGCEADVNRMSSRIIAVVLRGSRCMAGSALSIDVDGTG